ncbi:MAG: T9SS type A sorting domain-containing protein, partial [Bacteroidota bacterium]|nr:T9SS type A sorting domain-containing protein [Bacteroidota bacterium]
GFDKGYSIQVYNMLGKLVYEAKNITQRTTINLSDFTRGLYIYQLRDQSSRILETGKFQVSK